MTSAVSRVARLAGAAGLVLTLGLTPGSGEAATQGSVRQLTESVNPLEDYSLPSISADGTRIAFYRAASGGEIYVVNSDGTGLQRVVGGGPFAQSPPSLSADGEWLAFLGTPTLNEGLNQIYLVRTDGTSLRQLTPSLTGNPEEDEYRGYPRFSPAISGDGSLVVFPSMGNFTRQNTGHRVVLFAIKADGTGLRQIRTPDNLLTAHAPAVDHNGTRVAFLQGTPRLGTVVPAADPPTTNDESLYVVNTDGSGLLKLSVAACYMSWYENLGLGPAISGDGSLVAFYARINPAPAGGCAAAGIAAGFYTIRTDGTGLQQVSGVSYPHFPSLSYDGSRIAFADSYAHPIEEGGNVTTEVFVANADGSGLARLTSPAGGPGNPVVGHSGRNGVALSADGSRVAFASNADLQGRNADHSQEVYVSRLFSLTPVQGVLNRRAAADRETNRHSLVARRDLVVRAFFDTGVGGPSVPAVGRLVVDQGTANEQTFVVFGHTAQPLGYFDNRPDDRLQLDSTLDFFITGGDADRLLNSGVHSFKARIEPEGGAGFTPWEESFQATFRQADTVDIFIIPVRVRNAAGALVGPDPALLQNASDFLRAVYPVDESRERVRNIVLAPLDLNQPPNIYPLDFILAHWIRLRLDAQLLSGLVLDPARHNFAAGVLPNTVDGLNPIGGDLGYTYPDIGGAVVSLDRDVRAPNPPVIGSTIAHEVGHQLGLGDEYTPSPRTSPNNPPPAAAADGDGDGNYVMEVAGALRTADREAVFSRPGARVRGYMGAGHDQNSWATGIDYAYLYNRTTTDTVGAPAAAAASTRFINVSGVVTRTGGIQLNPFLVATSPYTFTRPSGTQYAFQFKDSGGVVLDSVGFDAGFTKEVRGVGYLPVDAAPFSFTVPLPEGVSSMAVLTATTPMITYTVSARPPTVTVLAPNGGETLHQPAQVRWQASDPDGDSLTYAVLYSPGGSDRYVAATGITSTTYELDFGGLPPGDRASVIVRASDGFNYAEDASDAPFTAGWRRVFVPVLVKNAGAW